VVRHRLVGDIVDAYTRWDADREATASSPRSVRRQPGRRG
jgi:phosphate starvation-inducible PhoH-like protein